MPKLTILEGDVLARLRELPDESVQMCVTSPPYYGLRDYKLPPSIWGGEAACAHQFTQSKGLGKGWSSAERRESAIAASRIGVCQHCGAWRGCHGLEPSLDLYVAHEVMIFREVRRVLKNDGTCWVNLGDSYASGWPCSRRNVIGNGSLENGTRENRAARLSDGLKNNKDLCGVPWRVAFALQGDGWWLRQDIIWHKPNPMPESITDRCTKAHEYLFLLSKSARYYFDQEAIKELAGNNTHARRARATMENKSAPTGERNGIRPNKPAGWATGPDHSALGWQQSQSEHPKNKLWNGSTFHRGKTAEHLNGTMQTGESRAARKLELPGIGTKNDTSFEEAMSLMVDDRNKRSVWTVASMPFKEAHFATFPPDLIKPCILAGSRPGDVVLDPLGGSGTTGMVSLELGRNAVLIELNPEYVAMARRRCLITPGLNLEAAK